jgi:hypothetical protein
MVGVVAAHDVLDTCIIQMAAIAGDAALMSLTCQFEYDCGESHVSNCVMLNITRSTADSAAIGSIVKMQKKLLHCYVSLLRRVMRMENARQPSTLVAAGDWICPVCLHPFIHRDSLKGHVRYNVNALSIMPRPP